MDKNYTFDDYKKKEQCGNCTNWDHTVIDNNGCSYCSKSSKWQKYSYDDLGKNNRCSNYKKTKDENLIRNSYNKIYSIYNPSASPCFITTMLVNILGKGDNCHELNILRNFRDTFLQRNPYFLSMLAEYDLVGPIIANEINLLDNKEAVANAAFEKFIKPTVRQIENENYVGAINIYKLMFDYFKFSFNIPDLTPELIKNYNNEINQEQMGHGGDQRVRVKNENL